ncbi:MAG: 30S ribosomal protein S15 [Candidatus Buchananbacteria bacterium CG10_big_fil_rev_8_21_14_0_10_42_9]|uniref:Small ribosomal subunit protein uS15 n=1 Tax=Candidatus Buchananbacteria bacterium CG10_big_fil_rev_8_21_14_0_10_42_9 TaxID=1974526 RepID=A0A2H0W062_9BACT|nr:MAG: 30S ribosomal protein S15 [Candidatus Buchananbacteria bacterium CG10_big_fil_rev_8_21_14_0_10_42_9]
MLTKDQKEKIIKKYRTHTTDTGSPQVQIAILTAEIDYLTKHLKQHKKDFSSRRGLIRKVGERRSLLNYLFREDETAWEDIVKKLKIKIARPQTEELSEIGKERDAAAALEEKTSKEEKETADE